MPEGQVLEFSRATKRFGAVAAVSDLTVRVEPGVVTGFLGPNGAGKTTSLRMLLGQIRPTSGTATVGGVPYSELRHPLRTIGAVLEEAVYRPRRTAMRQLLIAAKANGIPTSRVDEVLRLVGLHDDADTRIGGYSLGMRQRLSVATALLGDPGALVLDEPANGLDPEGIRWMRLLMRRLADEGRTVLVSSHVLSEIEQIADHIVVLSKGRAVYAGSIEDLADPGKGAVVVDAEDRDALAAALTAAGLPFDVLRSGVTVRGSDAAAVGAVAAAAGIALTTLVQRGPSLEDVFLDLVYGRRVDSPRLDEVANPVAHALPSDDIDGAGNSTDDTDPDTDTDTDTDDASGAEPEPAEQQPEPVDEEPAPDEQEAPITGVPSASNGGDGAPTAAIPVIGTPPSADDDDAVDDEDDPRLTAMRTSLSAAASRFFEGDAPDYPYGGTAAEATGGTDRATAHEESEHEEFAHEGTASTADAGSARAQDPDPAHEEAQHEDTQHEDVRADDRHEDGSRSV